MGDVDGSGVLELDFVFSGCEVVPEAAPGALFVNGVA
jgi:hypothetical protein